MGLPSLEIPGNLTIIKTKEQYPGKPIEYITTWIKKHMHEYGYERAELIDRILIIRSETGSGKSTALPVALLRIIRGMLSSINQRMIKPSVICTQPRVITAKKLAEDISSKPWNPDIVLGKTVGYSTGKLSHRLEGGILYVTADVLRIQIQKDNAEEIMQRYKFIIIDEAHERPVTADILLMLLKNFYMANKGNKNLPFLILTSATFDVFKYQEYFEVDLDNIFHVTGRAYAINKHWPEESCDNYIEKFCEIVKQIDTSEDEDDKGDILLFIPGKAEAKQLHEMLTKINAELTRQFILLNVNSDVVETNTGDILMLQESLASIRERLGINYKRKVIITTNVSETGLTIETLKYVIDCGWNKTNQVYFPSEIGGLITVPITQSRVLQRMGRVGREFDGEFYPTYTKADYDRLDKQQLPGIFTEGINNYYLIIVKEQQLKKLINKQFADYRAEHIDMLDMPASDTIIVANSIAFFGGLISTKAQIYKSPKIFDHGYFTTSDVQISYEDVDKTIVGYGLTRLGIITSGFTRTSQDSACILFSSIAYSVSMTDAITIATLYGSKSLKEFYTLSFKDMKNPMLKGLPPGSDALYLVLKYMFASVGRKGQTESDITIEDYIRFKYALADDFIEFLIIYDHFCELLSDSLTVATAWCLEAKLNLEALMTFMDDRNIKLNDVKTAKLNPFRLIDKSLYLLLKETIISKPKAVDLNDKIITYMSLIKKCVRESSQLRVLTFDKEKYMYKTLQGNFVPVCEQYSDKVRKSIKELYNIDISIPEKLITDKIVLKQSQRESDGTTKIIYSSVMLNYLL